MKNKQKKEANNIKKIMINEFNGKNIFFELY